MIEQGWQCPICLRIYAPSVRECCLCGGHDYGYGPSKKHERGEERKLDYKPSTSDPPPDTWTTNALVPDRPSWADKISNGATVIDLDAIEARCKAATPGPWTREDGSFAYVMIACEPLMFEPGDGPVGTTDAEFVAHARTDVEQMAQALRSAERVMMEARSMDVPGANAWLARWLGKGLR